MTRMLPFVLVAAVCLIPLSLNSVTAQETDKSCQPTTEECRNCQALKFELVGIDLPFAGFCTKASTDECNAQKGQNEISIQLRCEHGVPMTNIPYVTRLFKKVGITSCEESVEGDKQCEASTACQTLSSRCKAECCAGQCPASCGTAQCTVSCSEGQCTVSCGEGQCPATGCAGQCPATCSQGQCPATCSEGQCPATGCAGQCPATCSEGQCAATCSTGQCPATCSAGQCPAASCATQCPAGSCGQQEDATTGTLVRWTTHGDSSQTKAASHTAIMHEMMKLRIENERLHAHVEAMETHLEMMAEMSQLRAENAALQAKLEMMKSHTAHAHALHMMHHAPGKATATAPAITIVRPGAPLPAIKTAAPQAQPRLLPPLPQPAQPATTKTEPACQSQSSCQAAKVQQLVDQIRTLKKQLHEQSSRNARAETTDR